MRPGTSKNEKKHGVNCECSCECCSEKKQKQHDKSKFWPFLLRNITAVWNAYHLWKDVMDFIEATAGWAF